MPLSASSASVLRGVIDQSLASAPTAGGGVGGPAPTDFCSLWPEAKPILQALVSVVSAIPGIGKNAGPILSSLISVGDTVYQQTCHAASGPASSSAHAEVRALINQSLAAPVAASSVNFCSVWPEAKPILQLLSGIVGFIPGVGAAAGPILASLVAVGDTVFKQTCPST